MECPKCGYAMSDFDVDCPRCVRMKTQTPAPTTKPALVAPAPPPSPMPMQTPYPQVSAPPRPRPIAVSHGMAWVAGCCPILGVGVDLILNSMGISSGWIIFAVCLSINGAILEGDRKYLAGLGLDTSSLKNAWLIPAYLFGRPAVAGGGNGYAVLWCLLFTLSFIIPSVPVAPPVTDGQQIDASAHFESLDQQGTTWTGVIVIDDGPLKGQKLSGGGVTDSSFTSGSTVRVSGTVHLQGNQLTVNPMQVTPGNGP